jgi:ATP-binding cassette subfamily F protein 3
MASKEILLEALQRYNGTILFIAHDRYFMDQLAEKILELKEGVLTVYQGNYADYIRKISEVSVSTEPQIAEPAFHKSRDQKKLEAEQRNKLSRFKKEVMEPLARLEESIQKKEVELEELEKMLADNKIYSEGRHHEYLVRYEKLKHSLEGDYQTWEKLQNRKQELEASG